MTYRWLRPLLFAADPELAHESALDFLAAVEKIPGLDRWLGGRFRFDHPVLQTTVFGINFPNPVGLAAGFDKNAVAPRALALLGFGFIEVGTVTPRPQPGNPRPRLFRLPEDEAIINRLGFNNDGAPAMARRLQFLGNRNGRLSPDRRGEPRTMVPVPLGINIGKNRQTANERAAEDYCRCLQVLFPYADYFVVNVSSPNTPGLRDLQRAGALRDLLQALQAENKAAAARHRLDPRPILLKVAPDLSPQDLFGVLGVADECRVSGIIATNTTVLRPPLSSPYAAEHGGLSGRPLRRRSTEMVAAIYRWTSGKVPIIGVGGVFSGEDAYEKIRAGASLVQIYTGLIYGGPALPAHINRRLVRLLQQDGFRSVAEAVGTLANHWADGFGSSPN